MSFLAKLYINGRVINVLDTNIQFYQDVNPISFKPSALPAGGVFNMTLEADGTTDLLNLAVAPDTMCNGYIRFYKRDGMSKLVDYEFYDTYVVAYKRVFEGYMGRVTTDHYTLSPGILRIGDMVFEKWWKVTDLAANDTPIATPELKKSPKVTDYYITDSEGNRIEETKIGQTITLNIRTQDMIGETMTINLDNPSADFMYQGKVLENDTLADLTITKKIERIKLEVVKQGTK
ncbi:type VI secretion system tube protein TssD [Maribacter sp. 2-571]|uniref:type VI secretion system tube protein TssD n=1 Tax=Maribacter sp. 2-571 TaxID=3417569 RepID=UPI003D331276